MNNLNLLNKLASIRYSMQEAEDNGYDRRYDALSNIEFDLCQQLGIDDNWSPIVREYAFGSPAYVSSDDRKTIEDYLEELKKELVAA